MARRAVAAVARMTPEQVAFGQARFKVLGSVYESNAAAKRAYDAENVVMSAHPELKLTSNDETRAFHRRVITSGWWTKTLEPTVGRPSLEFTNARCTASMPAFKNGYTELRMPRYTVRQDFHHQLVILHELAHSFSFDLHGHAWQAAYVGLVARFVSHDVARELHTAFLGLPGSDKLAPFTRIVTALV